MNQETLPPPWRESEFVQLSQIRLSVPVEYSFLLYWVRRVSQTEIIGELGTRLRPPRNATVSIFIKGHFRIFKSTDFDGRKWRLRVYRTTLAEPELQIEATAPSPAPTDADPVLKTVFHQANVRDAIYHLVPKYLKSKYTAFCRQASAKFSRHEPLLDVTFPETEAGYASCQRAREGDFTGIYEPGSGIESRRADLNDALSPAVNLALYLPQLDKKDWKSPAAVIERSPIRCNDAEGQIFVGWPEQRVLEGMLRLAGFAASNSEFIDYTWVEFARAMNDTRSVVLTYLTSWFQAPGDREAAYTAAYGEISLAVQQFLRQELPRRWFSKPERYARLADSHTMLVYKCSRPFVGRTRTELTYEFQNPDSMKRFYKTANLALPAELDAIQESVRGSGLERHYQRIFSRDIVQSVASRRRNLDRLMSAESTIIECFIEFGRAGHEFRHRMSSHPDQTAEGIARYAADFARALTYRAKRIHPALDCGDLALPLLIEASSALNSVLRGKRAA